MVVEAEEGRGGGGGEGDGGGGGGEENGGGGDEQRREREEEEDGEGEEVAGVGGDDAPGLRDDASKHVRPRRRYGSGHHLPVGLSLLAEKGKGADKKEARRELVRKKRKHGLRERNNSHPHRVPFGVPFM